MCCEKIKFVLLSLTFVILYICGGGCDDSGAKNVKTKTEDEYEGFIKGSEALLRYPLIDGHNDLAWTLALHKQNRLKDFDFTKNLSNAADFNCAQCKHTDLPKLRKGRVGAQFWAAYVDCETQYKDAVTHTLAQIDVIKRLVQKYSDDLWFVTTANTLMRAFQSKRIGSLIGVEGGHSIQYNLALLRIYYELGVRYMTLTHMCSTPWADASPVDTGSTYNLTQFGKKVIWEMNRLGMIVDLSHVSHNVMLEALKTSLAPVIFSHSSAHGIYGHHRNVRDDVLQKVKENGGVIMVNFFTDFIGQPDSTIYTVADHINHIVDVCGIDCVGIGGDYNGVERMPVGLEDVSKYPDLFDILRRQDPERWTILNLEKLAGRNFMRVFTRVEKIKDSLKHLEALEDWIPEEDLEAVDNEALKSCNTNLRKLQ